MCVLGNYNSIYVQENTFFLQKEVSDQFNIFLMNPKRTFLFFFTPVSLYPNHHLLFLIIFPTLPTRKHSAHLCAKHRQTEAMSFPNSFWNRRSLLFMQESYYFCFPLAKSDGNSSEVGECSTSSESDFILVFQFLLWSSVPQNLDKVLWETRCGVRIVAEVHFTLGFLY